MDESTSALDQGNQDHLYQVDLPHHKLFHIP